MPLSICRRALPILLLPVAGLSAQATELQATESTIMHHAKGTFEVELNPLEPGNEAARAAGLGRMSLDKRYHGPMEAVGAGEMLFSGDGTRSGAYVAIENVSGRLDGREGSFVLVHHALMNQGRPEAWTVTVVPGSGTGALSGLSGALTITVVDGTHHYEFGYAIDEAAAPGE